jgi:hypothetical protein
VELSTRRASCCVFLLAECIPGTGCETRKSGPEGRAGRVDYKANHKATKDTKDEIQDWWSENGKFEWPMSSRYVLSELFLVLFVPWWFKSSA